jgi:PAS domain S-box-containing protein
MSNKSVMPPSQLQNMLAASNVIHASTRTSELLQVAVEQLRRIITTQLAIICYQEPEQDCVSTYIAGPDPSGTDFRSPERKLSRFLCQVASGLETTLQLTQEQLERHPELNGSTLPEGLPELQGLLSTPLTRRDGSRMGAVLLFGTATGFRFSEQDQTALVQFSMIVSTAVENRERQERTLLRVMELEKIEEHYEVALDNAQTGTFEHQLETDREIWSAPLRHLYGVAEDVTASYGTWLQNVHPADRERADAVVQAAMLEEATEFTQQFRILHPVKGERWMLARGWVVNDEHGAPNRVVGTVVDITMRKKVEEHLAQRARQQAVVAQLGRDALAGMPLQELMSRIASQVTEVLDVEFCKILELMPSGEDLLLRAGTGWREGLVGTALVSATHDSQAGYTLQRSKPVVVTDLAQETRFRKPALLLDHQVVSGLSVVIHGESGPWGVMGVYTTLPARFSEDDVHFIEAIANLLADAIVRARWELRLEQNREALETRVKERTAQLQISNRELEAFAYSVSHDLRAPLRGVDGFSQILLEDYGPELDETAQGYLLRVRAAAKRMGELIDDLLSLSRVSSSGIRRSRIDLSAKVTRLAQELSAAEPERDVHFQIQPGVTVEADPKLVRIAFENLLDNAWKFTRFTEHAEISFGVMTEGNQAVYFVRDNGIGFDMTRASRLFAPFQRLHSEDQFEGTGIGLATVERIVRRHGGRVWAESQPGEGTKVLFTLEDAPAP